MAGLVEVRGGRNLSRIARDLKAAGNGDLRKELLRGIRKGTKTAIPDVRAAALRDLPKRGGLAERVAGQKFGARTSLGKTPRVRIVGQGMKELQTIDDGSVRHPVRGNRKIWVAQRAGITPGFFSSTLKKKAPEIRHALDDVMGDIARKIERGT